MSERREAVLLVRLSQLCLHTIRSHPGRRKYADAVKDLMVVCASGMSRLEYLKVNATSCYAVVLRSC